VVLEVQAKVGTDAGQIGRSQLPSLPCELDRTEVGRTWWHKSVGLTAGFHDTAVKACVVGSDEADPFEKRPEFMPQFLECWLALHVSPGDAMYICKHKVG